MNWWPVSYMLHWSFHWPVSTELAEKSQGEARLTTLLWDLQGMHGSCKEWQCGTEGKDWSPVKLCGQGREAQDEAALSYILGLLSSTPEWNRNFIWWIHGKVCGRQYWQYGALSEKQEIIWQMFMYPCTLDITLFLCKISLLIRGSVSCSWESTRAFAYVNIAI